MKLNRVAAVALLVATSLGSWAAGEAPTASAWEKVKTYTHQQKNEAVAEGKKLIAATDREIGELTRQTKSSTSEALAEHEKNMKELKAKKREAQVHLNKMTKASGNAWEATKDGFANAGKELQAAYEKATASAKK